MLVSRTSGILRTHSSGTGSLVSRSPARTVVESAAVAVLEPTPRQLAQAAPLPQGQFDEAFE